ncbi:hypothetical protein pb186bvf_002712 [Paramecium bursaria]
MREINKYQQKYILLFLGRLLKLFSLFLLIIIFINKQSPFDKQLYSYKNL